MTITAEDLVGLAAMVAAQAYCFALSTTGLAIRVIGLDRLPPFARRLAAAYRLSPSIRHLVGSAFWALLAIGLLVALVTNWLLIHAVRDLLAAVASLVVDVVWVAYLFGSRDKD